MLHWVIRFGGFALFLAVLPMKAEAQSLGVELNVRKKPNIVEETKIAPDPTTVTPDPVVPPDPTVIPGPDGGKPGPVGLQLEVVINGVSAGVVGTFVQLPDCDLAALPQELADVGIKPTGQKRPDGRMCLRSLQNMKYRVDMQTQRLYVDAEDRARAAKLVNIDPAPEREHGKPQSGTGMVLNYSLFSSSSNLLDHDVRPFRGVSGGFDARFFSPFGTVNQSFTANLSDGELQGIKRLNTTWNYSDPERMMSYRAGDIASGGLAWTRPVYLGGMQIRRNFSLRSDLITLPMPNLSGSAAVPSTLEVYTNNVKTYSGDVPAGPFQLTNFPVVTGSGQAQVVLRDTLGRETKTSLPFYTSSQFLAPGLLDFSVEAGYPRRNFGVESNDYAGDLFGSATARYGATNWLTLEGHMEGGNELANGGLGVAFPLASYGALSLAAAGSRYNGESGALLNTSLELSHGSYSLYGRMQRSFGSYDDIASVSADRQRRFDYYSGGYSTFSARVPRSLTQVSIGVPSPVKRSSVNFSYTQVEDNDGDQSRTLSASYSQSVFKSSSLYVTGFKSLDDNDNFGIFAALSIPFDNNLSSSTGIEQTSDGLAVTADISRSEQSRENSYGWRVRDREGAVTDRSLSASYRARYARVEGEVQQYGDSAQASVWVDGAVAAAGGGIFATNRISDAFAVVDVGAPDVEVSYENRPVGHTDRGGRLLVPDLNSYEANHLSIDPKNLPVDAAVGSTREVVTPADQSGVVVNFHVKETGQAAIVSLVDKAGHPLQSGLEGMLAATGDVFVVGYDGEAYIEGLSKSNAVSIILTDGQTCRAEFPFAAKPGTQMTIKNVVCQ